MVFSGGADQDRIVPMGLSGQGQSCLKITVKLILCVYEYSLNVFPFNFFLSCSKFNIVRWVPFNCTLKLPGVCS